MTTTIGQFNDQLKAALQQKYPQLEAQALLEQRWTTIRSQACQNAGVKWGDLSLEAQAKVQQAIQGVVAAVDSTGYRLFPQRTGEETRVQQLVRHLFYPHDSLPIPSWEELECILWKFNPDMMRQAEEEVRGIFPYLYEQIKDGGHPEEITDALVNHLVDICVFLNPVAGTKIQIPRKLNEKWVLVEHEIEKIPLTSGALTSIAYAWGFVPVDKKEVSPLLVFRGTTHLSAEGAFIGYMADFTPFCSIGELIYRQGKGEIQKFIERFPDRMVQVQGHSLGGALAILTGEDFPSQTIVRANAAPGKLFKTAPLQGDNTYHEDDILVPTLGMFSSDLKLRKALTFDLPGEVERHECHGHLLPAVGCGPSILLNVSTEAENRKLLRKIYTVAHQIFAIPTFVLMSLYLLIQWMILRLIKLIPKS